MADAWRTDGRTFPPSDMPVPPWENQISPLFFLSLFFRRSLPPLLPSAEHNALARDTR